MAREALTEDGKRRWGAEQRLEFIELRAFWEGGLNRGDIREQFGVSAPQASNDIATYMELVPGNLVYDNRLKRYLSAEGFKPGLVKSSATAYLHQLADATAGSQTNTAWQGTGPGVATIPIPGRVVDAEVLRALLVAMRQRSSVEILYQSMSPTRPIPQWREVTPHSLATDGLRWHARAYCHEGASFRDFVLSRIRDTRPISEPGILGAKDADWNTTTEVCLVPNPDLSSDQQSAVDWDYNMGGAKVLKLVVRNALLYYLRQRLRLDVPYDRPSERPVVVADPDGFDAAIKSATGAILPS